MFLLGAFVFLLAYYYFVLRRFNTLGFRLFSLCFFVSLALVYWWWGDWHILKQLEQEGIRTEATVLQKKLDGSEWLVEVSFRDQSGHEIVRSTKGGMSVEELAAVEPNRPTSIRFSPDGNTFMLEETFQRQNHDLSWVLLFPLFLFILGLLAWFFLRKYRVHAHEGTIYEYVTNEEGKVVLDDAKNETTKSIHKMNLISKLLQLFSRNG